MLRSSLASRALVGSFVALFAALNALAPAVADPRPPSIAVLDFDTRGLTGNWWGQFEPGVAISDLVTDQLVNQHKFNVLERSKLGMVMDEHKLSTDGEVSPATMISRGRLTGARYLVTGNVLQFDRTGSSGAAGAAGALIGGFAGAVLGGIKRDRVTLKVQVHIVDTTTGQIVLSFAGEKTQASTSWGAGGFGGLAAGGYGNESFTSSTMGHLINDEAIEISSKLDPAQFVATGPPPVSLSGHVLASDSGGIILNIGSGKGVENGMYFDVVKLRRLKDPESGRILLVSQPVGKLQITEVNADSAVGTRVSGIIVTGEKVQSEP